MSAQELFPTAPNVSVTDVVSVKVPAYCWLRPRPPPTPSPNKEQKRKEEDKQDKDDKDDKEDEPTKDVKDELNYSYTKPGTPYAHHARDDSPGVNLGTNYRGPYDFDDSDTNDTALSARGGR